MARAVKVCGFSVTHLESIAKERAKNHNGQPPSPQSKPSSSGRRIKSQESIGTKAQVGPEGREGINGFLLPHPHSTGIGYFLDGRPVPKERPRLVVSLPDLRTAVMAMNFKAAKAAFSIQTPTKTIRYERRIAAISREAMGGMASSRELIEIRLHFTLSRRAGGRPDIDNLVKTVLDGMNGVFWIDDRQVRKIETTLEFTNEWPEGVMVMASALDSDAGLAPALQNYIAKRR